MKSPIHWHNIKETVGQFLVATTIHGCRYLYEGKNLFEKLFWAVLITVHFATAAYLISSNYREAMKDPILTTLHTTRVEHVPFPAITIAGDPNANPWGFVEKLFNALAFYDPQDKEKPSTYEKSEDLRQRFGFILKKMSNKMGESLAAEKANMNLTDIKEYGQNDKDHKISQNFNKIKKIAPKFAAIALTDSRSYRYIKEVIDELFVDALFKLKFYLLGSQFLPKVESAVDDTLAGLGADQTVTSCENESESCKNKLKEAYLNLYSRFEIYKFPFPPLGFGLAMSYFSILMTNNMDQIFLDRAKPYYEETAYRKYMAEVLQRIDKAMQVGNVSIFELVKLLHKNSDEIGSKSNPSRVYMDESNCELDANDDLKNGVYENRTFCQLQSLTQNQKNCCAALTKFENQLDTVLKIFRYSLQPPSYSEELADIYGIYGNLSLLGPYTNVTDVPKQETQLFGDNQNARVLMCKYLGEVDHFSPSKCKLFHRSITTEGIGYTFNNANFWDIYSDTEYNTKFASIMRPKGFDRPPNPSQFDEEDEDQRWLYPKEGILFPKTSGPTYGLTIVLQGLRSDPSPFKVAIHDPMAIADLRRTGIEIEPGYISTFLITPSQIVTSKTARDMKEEVRQCRFPFESKNLTLFTQYTQSNCLFECQMRQAYKECHCIPWNYPHFEENQPICHRFTRQCFESAMTDPKTADKCTDCLYDCATTRYSYSVSSTAFDLVNYCKGGSQLTDAFKAFLGSESSYPPKIIRRFEQVVFNKDINNDDICKDNLKNVAIVKFQLASQMITRIKKTERVTFSDMVSNFGGALGLFTGISIISIFELVFWCLRLVQKQ